MGGYGRFIDSIDDVYVVAGFIHQLSEATAESKVAEQDGWTIAKSAGLEVPDILAGTSIEAAQPATPDARFPGFVVTLPPDATARRGISVDKCWKICKSGPLDIGKVCVNVCVKCEATMSEVRCTATITIVASL
jgi:hypothetical protein